VAGLLASYHADVAAGGTIVLVATAVFGLVWLLAPAHGALATLRRRRRVPADSTPESQVVFESPEIRTTPP